MTTIQVLGATVAVLVLGYGLWRLHWWHVRQALQVAANQASDVFATGSRLLSEQVAALQIEVENARQLRDEADRKCARYLDKIQEFERQRTTWQKLYYDQATGHGNAQEMMMNTIETLARQLQSLGQRPKIPSVLHAVRSEYLTTHEMPARAANEAIEAAKVAAPQPQPTQETHPGEG
jgi:ABC-type transporter Mla subunit MlaD